MSKKKKKNRREPETLELSCVGVETHAHLDLEDFDEDREELLERARACGVSAIGNVFLGPDAFERNRPLFDAHPEVFFLLGIHPNNTDRCTDDDLERMRAHFKAEPRLLAVGEIGLDFYWDHVPHDVQAEAFVRQLHMARELGKPVVIHSRDAHERTVEILEAEGFRDYPVLWHCFGGDAGFAARVVSNGWMVSVPGPVTFNKNVETQAAVASVPLDRLVLETDCPYLTPEPWRGKRNHPALVVFTAEKVALLKAISVQDLWRITGENARRFFGLEKLAD
jgi:TatD DNase family protein